VPSYRSNLRYQLHFSLARIVEAGGTTLEQTYQRLTGSSGAFSAFAALVQRHYPAGTPVNLPGTDNVFPLLDAASWGGWESLGGVLGIFTPSSGLGTESARHLCCRNRQRTVAPLVGRFILGWLGVS